MFPTVLGAVMSASPLVTVVTAATGDPRVMQAIESVAAQSHRNIQHLVVLDNPQAPTDIKMAIRQRGVDLIELPYPTGKDRFNGHRIYGASAFLGRGDHFCFLDEDNWFDPDHVAALLDVTQRGFSWAFSFRKIVDGDGTFICDDDCESLGKWPTILSDQDFHVDTGCYFLPRLIALQSGPIWYRRFRDPPNPDPDRALVEWLLSNGCARTHSTMTPRGFTASITVSGTRPTWYSAISSWRAISGCWKSTRACWHHRHAPPLAPRVSVTWQVT
jgi:glycosyltransferase involved in cell wall biosynthesis